MWLRSVVAASFTVSYTHLDVYKRQATDSVEKTELRLMTESHGQAIVVLPGSSYYESLESAMKIRKMCIRDRCIPCWKPCSLIFLIYPFW